MAAELAAGYVSLTVKLAKGGMADVTKEVKKAGQEGGKEYSDEFNKKVGDEVGKKLPDTIGKSTKGGGGGGGLAKAAKEAAEEFSKGFREGVGQALDKLGIDEKLDEAFKKGGFGKASKTAAEEFGKGLRDGIQSAAIEGALSTVSTKIKDVTTEIGNIGDAFGVGTTGIQDASRTVTDAIDGIATSVNSTKTAMDAFKSGDVGGGLQATVDALKGLEAVGLPTGAASAAQRVADDAAKARTNIDGVIGPLEHLTELAGPDSKLYAAGKKLPLVGDLLEFGIAAHEAGNEVEDFIKQSTGLNIPLSGISLLDQLTGGFHTLTTAAEQSQAKLDAALAAARAAGPAPSVAERGPRSGGRAGGRAGGGSISGPGGPKSDIIPIWVSPGEHVLSAADVAAMGGQNAVYNFRKMLGGFAGGGAVNAEIEAVSRIASARGLKLISGFRDPSGPTIAGVPAARSYHGSGQAGDFSNGSGNTPEMLAFAKFMAATYGTSLAELIYSDPGMPELVKDGRVVPASFYGAGTLSGHRDHVHVAIKTGAAPGLVAGTTPLPGTATSAAGIPGVTSSPSTSANPALSSNPMQALQQLGAQQAALDTQKAEQVKKLLPDFGQLADIAAGGIRETLLPPGFSDPTQWKSTKSIGALLGWIGGLTGDPAAASILGGIGAGITGSGSGLVNGIMGAIPQPFGNLAPATANQFGTGGGQIPAGPMPPNLFGAPGVSIGTYNDNSGNSAYAGAQTESHIHNSPQRTDLTRIARQ